MNDIFSYNPDFDKTAYLNWRTHFRDDIQNMIVIAEGFRDSSLLLVEEILKSNEGKRADNIIFPILFNANHSIELYLKAISWTQNRLLNNQDTFEGNHNLKNLLKNVVNLESDLDNSNDKTQFNEMLDYLNKYIKELYGKIERIIQDKKGNDKTLHEITFSRYALTNDLEPQFYVNTFENVTVDLENFYSVFKQIFYNLDSLYSHYYHQLDSKQMGEAEAAEYRED